MAQSVSLVVGVWGSGLAGLHLKGGFLRELFAI